MHAVGSVALEKLWERVKSLIPTKVSAFTNDAGYLTEVPEVDLTEYYTKTQVDAAITKAISEFRDLPNGYTRVNYIQSSGSQYINTGVTPNGTTGFEADFITTNEITDASGSYGCVFGARKSSGQHELQLTTYSNSSSYTGTFRYGTGNNNAKLATNKRMICSFLANRYTSSQGVSSAITSQTVSPGVPLVIFALNSNGDITQHSKVKLYGLKLYDGIRLVRDFIPVKNSSGKAGLYDKVNGKFYSNSGSGSFTTG